MNTPKYKYFENEEKMHFTYLWQCLGQLSTFKEFKLNEIIIVLSSWIITKHLWVLVELENGIQWENYIQVFMLTLFTVAIRPSYNFKWY